MAKKKKDLGLWALTGGSYFAPKKITPNTQKNGLKLRKYDPVARAHVWTEAKKSKRVTAK